MTFLDLGDIFMYNNCQCQSAVSLKILQNETESLRAKVLPNHWWCAIFLQCTPGFAHAISYTRSNSKPSWAISKTVADSLDCIFSVDVSAAITRDSLPTGGGSTKEGGYPESLSGFATTSTTENHVHGHHVWYLPSIQTGKLVIFVRYVPTDNIKLFTHSGL